MSPIILIIFELLFLDHLIFGSNGEICVICLVACIRKRKKLNLSSPNSNKIQKKRKQLNNLEQNQRVILPSVKTNHWSDSFQRNIISSMSEVNEQYLIENWNKNFPKKNCTSYLVINSLCTEEVVITTIYYYQLKHYNFLVNSNLQTLMYFIYILRHLPPIKHYYLHTLCKS